jgi:hypothetical protein
MKCWKKQKMPKCVRLLGQPPTQTVKGEGHRLKPVHGPTQIDQIGHDLGPKRVGPLEMPLALVHMGHFFEWVGKSAPVSAGRLKAPAPAKSTAFPTREYFIFTVC